MDILVKLVENTTKRLFLLSFVAFIFSTIAFMTPNWLESRSNKYFTRAGLWVFCFKQLPDPKFQYTSLIDGCYHVFNENLWHLRDIFMPGFFVATQTTFVIGFLLNIVGFTGFICYIQRLLKSILWLHFISVLHLGAAFWITVAVVIFGVRGDGRDWMPDWRKNHISWAFAFAVISAILQYLIGISLMIRAHRRLKKIPLRKTVKIRISPHRSNKKTKILYSRIPDEVTLKQGQLKGILKRRDPLQIIGIQPALKNHTEV